MDENRGSRGGAGARGRGSLAHWPSGALEHWNIGEWVVGPLWCSSAASAPSMRKAVLSRPDVAGLAVPNWPKRPFTILLFALGQAAPVAPGACWGPFELSRLALPTLRRSRGARRGSQSPETRNRELSAVGRLVWHAGSDQAMATWGNRWWPVVAGGGRWWSVVVGGGRWRYAARRFCR
jgi:hypothetical protein